MSNTAGRDISPRTDTNVVKCGHLKKQGGARGGRRNWKRRWFILKSDYICYFQEKDGKSTDGPCLGVLPLRSAKVVSVEYVPDDVTPSAQTSPGASHPAASPITTCYMCQKSFTKKVVCKSCQNAFCTNCASELQMGDKTSRVCSKCRCHQADDDPVKEKGSALEMGIIVEVTQPEPKNSKFFKKERPQHLFAIKTKERELWLAAEDAQEKSAWIQAIAGLIMSFKKSATGTSESPMLSKEEPDMPSTPQSEIDYEEITILEKIGDGAFGEVFTGRLWGTDVAVKTIKPDQATEGVVEDLKKEVAILSQLRHPNVVLYIGACTKPPNVCIITEWCDRGSLHDVLHDSNIPLDIQRIVSLAVGIAQGMNYLHNLERRIIHRDLKSHNVVVDRNFNVKVADFGLSHVRESLTQRNPDSAQATTQALGFGQQRPALDQEFGGDDDKSIKITSESMGGHYGVFGTPEWMAPEIMEGTAYNQKVDVYSFGIMMSELLTRKLPFRDQYKIKSYLDVVDAVLDDGAMPTLPPWIGPRLKRLIELCLSRNANSRPSFTSIITKLRSIFSSSPADLFIAFDIPRITHMLSSTDRHNQALAAKEISLFKFDHEFLGDGERRVCARCKYSAAQHRPLDDATVTLFISKLTDMLASSSAKVVLPAVEALERLIVIGRQRSDSNLRTEHLRTICEKNGVERLIGLVASKSERLSQLASRALMLLVDDLPVDDMSYRALKPTSLNVLSSLMIKEMVNLRENSHKLNESLQEKKETVSALRGFLESAKTKQEASPSETEQSHTTNAIVTGLPIAIETEQTQQSEPGSAPSESLADGPSVIESFGVASMSHVEIAIQPKPATEDRDSNDVPAAQSQPQTSAVVASDQPVPVNSSNSTLDLGESRLQNYRTSGSEEPESATLTNTNANASINWPPTPEIPIPATHPASALDPQLVYADWVLIHDSSLELWKPRYVVVQPSLIFVYPSYEEMRQSGGVPPEFIVNAGVPAGRKLKYKTGRKYKQPYCFHLCCQGIKWWFALRSEKDTVFWGQILVLPLPETIETTMQRYIQSELRDGADLEQVDSANDSLSHPLSSQQDAPALSNATTIEESALSVAIGEVSAALQFPSSIVETPAPRTASNTEERDTFISVLPPTDFKPDKKSGKDSTSDVEEADKSQTEMQFDLLGIKSPDIDEKLSDGAAENDTIDRKFEFVDVVRQPEQGLPTSNQDQVEDAPMINSDTHSEDAVHHDALDYVNHNIADFQHQEQLLSINQHSIADLQAPMTPLALFIENANAPLTVRHRDVAQDVEVQESVSAVDYANALSEDRDTLSIVHYNDVTSETTAADALHDGIGINSAPLLGPCVSDDCSRISTEAINELQPVLKSGAPEQHSERFSIVQHSDHSLETVAADSVPEDNNVNAASLIGVSILNDNSRLSTNPGDELELIAAQKSDAIENDYVIVSASDATPIFEGTAKHADIGATNASASEVAADSSHMVNRFVKRYIDVAAPTTIDAKINVCLTIKSGDDLIRSDKTLQMNAMPSVPSLPAIFASEYGRRDCWQFAYLVIANIKTMKWERRFVILLGSHPRRLLAFKSHEALELVDEFVLEGLAHVADEHVVEKCLGFAVNVDRRLAFAVPVRSAGDEHRRDLLCVCSSEMEKNKWMSLLERVVLISRTAT